VSRFTVDLLLPSPLATQEIDRENVQGEYEW